MADDLTPRQAENAEDERTKFIQQRFADLDDYYQRMNIVPVDQKPFFEERERKEAERLRRRREELYGK